MAVGPGATATGASNGRSRRSKTLADPSTVYHVLDTTLIPAVVRVRAGRKGLFAGRTPSVETSPRRSGSTDSR